MKKRTSNAKRYYLAYGSNLNTVEMKYRCPSAKVIGTAEISGWRLLFRGNWMGYLTIEPCEGACVPVAVWEVSPDDESSLDSYEGFPDFYDKQDMRLPVRETGSREISERDAFIYIMKERFSPALPSESYLRTCQGGYRTFGFDETVLEEALRATREEIEKE